MDLTRPVYYRGFTLNDPTISNVPGGQIGSGIAGCVIDSVDLNDEDVIQFLEKRSEGDGMDAGRPFLGARRVRMAGTIYAKTRGLYFDEVQSIRSTLSPTLAYLDEPGDKGYRPLTWTEPTNRVDDFPTGVIDKQVLALPRAFQALDDRDRHGNPEGQPLAVPWTASFICRDPRITSVAPHDVAFVGSSFSGNLVNLGDYPALLNMLLVVGSGAGVITLHIADSQFTITVPASAGQRTIRYNGFDKVLTFEEAGLESVAQGKLVFQNKTTHPLIPGGTSPYIITTTAALLSGSHMWFYDTYA